MFRGRGSLASEAGFTLVEMLVTVTIIGVLAAVVTAGVSGASSTAQTQANKQLFASVQTGLDSYAASTPLATGVPTTGTATGGETGYTGADGATAVVILNTDRFVDFASSTNSFSTYFRLNNSSGTFKCVVASATTFSLKACHN
ncbi:MAG TPA: type II secretion system protein [Candidatus Limnocylindria bacterium]|nr:type II secretion system protein [Candidatus Limnocylindria bacterium]